MLKGTAQSADVPFSRMLRSTAPGLTLHGIVRVNISSDDGSGLNAASTIGCWFVGTVRQLGVDGLT